MAAIAPAVQELKDTLAQTFPEILNTIFWDKYWDNGKDRNGKPKPKGRWAPRLQASGKNPNSGDPHDNGLALDIFLFKTNWNEWALATELVNVFVANKAVMGWSAVIYDGITTDDFGGPKTYPGRDKHETHIHIEWPRSRGTASAGFSYQIQYQLDMVAASWRIGEQISPSAHTYPSY